MTRHFRFQSYLVIMFLYFNEENLQFPEIVFTTEIINNDFNYMNLIMSEVYRFIFQAKLPRFLLEMEDVLQFRPNKRIGDWFLLKEHTIIRVYGFVHEPYIFPAFLTPRVLCLEFIRHKLIVENEHFPNFRKSYEIKFHLKVGPFIIKNKSALRVI